MTVREEELIQHLETNLQTAQQFEKFIDFAPLLAVGLIWGITNAWMKRGSEGITKIDAEDEKQNNVQKQQTSKQHSKQNIKSSNIIISSITRFIREFIFLFSRLSYLLPFIINTSGSVLFYYSLANNDITVVVPVVTSLTFLFTHLTGVLLGEEFGSLKMWVGLVFVLIGVSVCAIKDE